MIYVVGHMPILFGQPVKRARRQRAGMMVCRTNILWKRTLSYGIVIFFFWGGDIFWEMVYTLWTPSLEAGWYDGLWDKFSLETGHYIVWEKGHYPMESEHFIFGENTIWGMVYNPVNT